LAGNNIVFGIVIALYNAYFLFMKENVDTKQEQS